jgi:transposase-like protein
MCRLTPGGGGVEGQRRVAEACVTANHLNSLIEQEHRRVKQRLRPMLGLKSFRTAEVVISGIELAEKIKKKQFHMSKVGVLTATIPDIWQAAPAA